MFATLCSKVNSPFGPGEFAQNRPHALHLGRSASAAVSQPPAADSLVLFRTVASAMLPARILLIDDHALFRCGLHMVLAAGIPGLEVAEAASLEDAMQCTSASPT